MRMTSYSSMRRRQHPQQGLLAAHLVHQLHLGRGQVDVGGQQVHAGHAGGHDDVVEGDVLLHQQVVDGQLHLVGVEPEADRERALRVEVDEQHLAAVLGQRRAEVDRGRGLADPALLVAHRDHPGAPVGGERPGLRDHRHRPAGGSDRAGGGRHDRGSGSGSRRSKGRGSVTGLGHGEARDGSPVTRGPGEVRGKVWPWRRSVRVGPGGGRGGGGRRGRDHRRHLRRCRSSSEPCSEPVPAIAHRGSSALGCCAVLSPSKLICRHGDLWPTRPDSRSGSRTGTRECRDTPRPSRNLWRSGGIRVAAVHRLGRPVHSPVETPVGYSSRSW